MNKLKLMGMLCSLLMLSPMIHTIPADALTLSNFFDPISITFGDLNDSVTITPYDGYEIASCECISG